MEKHKKCFKCGETKPLSAFYKHPRMLDGHVNKCKECNKRDVIENRKDKIDYYQDYDRNRPNHRERVTKRADIVKELYKESEDHRIAITKAKNYWLEKNKDKRIAQCAVNNAVRDSRLFKPQICSCCNKQYDKIYGHHWSYLESNWLDVVWLCAKCHGLEHKRINQFKRDSSEPYGSIESSEEVLPLLNDFIITLPDNFKEYLT